MKIQTYKDLQVVQKLFELHLIVHNLTMTFPKFEMYELGSQMRRSLNAAAANLAEGWNNKHLKIYLEGINRSFGELRETEHHLFVALRKNYLDIAKYDELSDRYAECGKMLRGLESSLQKYVP